jgi:DNA gyrase subunit B
MAAKKQEYGNESITSLKGADRVRKRPAVIFGSDGVEGCAHSIFEIISNSIDEARDGYGDVINVTRFADGSIQVEDFGRGMPVDWNKGEDRYNWELLFCEMYAGGKYGESSSNYEFSLGLNGLGLCATQYSSAWMTADIYRDATHYHLDFKQGENVGGLEKEPYSGRRTGSIIRWKPDDAVFTDTNVPGSYYRDILKRQAVVNAGLTLNYIDEKEPDPATGKPWKDSWHYEKGITDYVAEVAGEDTLTQVYTCESEATGRDRADLPDYKVKMSAAFCFSNKVQMLEYYHNSSWLEHGGSPEHAVKSAFVSSINKYLKDKNLYKKNESTITFQDVQDCLVYVSSSFSTQTSYENQTKKAITNKFVAQAMTDFLKHYLEVYFLEKPDEAQKLCQQVLVNKQSREHAEKTRQSIKKTLSTQMDLANRVAKFVDCRTKDPARRELYIVEGDSAMGAVKTSRDSEYQAIMPVRGKILNCLKADYDRIFKSDVIVDLIKVMGCGVELGGKHNKELATFSLDNLRFNKIVICTDADVDGYQIRTLVLTMLYRLTPTLIEKGYVYIAESPLYEINTKDRTYFAYTEPEKAAFLKEIGNAKYTIQRSKGLGENDPEMMWLTTMNPQSRRLIQVMPADAAKTAEVFDILLGDNLQGRKDHIAEHGAEYLDELDVS